MKLIDDLRAAGLSVRLGADGRPWVKPQTKLTADLRVRIKAQVEDMILVLQLEDWRETHETERRPQVYEALKSWLALTDKVMREAGATYQTVWEEVLEPAEGEVNEIAYRAIGGEISLQDCQRKIEGLVTLAKIQLGAYEFPEREKLTTEQVMDMTAGELRESGVIVRINIPAIDEAIYVVADNTDVSQVPKGCLAYSVDEAEVLLEAGKDAIGCLHALKKEFGPAKLTMADVIASRVQTRLANERIH